MNRILPYLPLPSKPITGAEAARHFDADAFDQHPDLVAFVRPMVELEFAEAPDALRAALAQSLQGPFRYLVEVRRGGGMFEHTREVVQVRAIGFDPSRDGVLRDGIVSNTPDRRRRSFQSLRNTRDPATP